MLETWIYMLVDKAFFTENGHEYAVALGEDDIKLCSTYDDAVRQVDVRSEVYHDLRYSLSYSDVGEEDSSIVYWKRLDRDDGYAHVLEIHKRVIFGDVFQVGQS